MNKQLKVFHCSHDGNLLFGISVVVATSKNAAKKLLIAELDKLKVGTTPTEKTKDEIVIEELDLTVPSVTVLFDGVY